MTVIMSLEWVLGPLFLGRSNLLAIEEKPKGFLGFFLRLLLPFLEIILERSVAVQLVGQ